MSEIETNASGVEIPARSRTIIPHGTALPPPRPGVRHVRVRTLGIVIADDDLRARIDRLFHWPMIVLALLVLPFLALELIFRPADGSALWWAIIVGFTVIWIAFTIEFLIKIAVAESRLEYVRRNWLDVVIIIIPLLRPLRAASVARTARVFTVRGVGMKLATYIFSFVIGLEATERFLARLGLKVRADRKNPTQMTRHELMDEVKRRRVLCDRWEAWYAQEQEFIGARGIEPFPAEAPTEERAAPLSPPESIEPAAKDAGEETPPPSLA